MDLKECRNKIDEIDLEMLRLYEKRMKVVREVANYKLEHHLPILNAGREDEVIQNKMSLASEEMKGYVKSYFINLMETSKCFQLSLLRPEQPAILENTPAHIREQYDHPGCTEIEVEVQIPNQSGELNRLLTKFSLYGINLAKIESLPSDETNLVTFLIVFEGRLKDQSVQNLLCDLENYCTSLKLAAKNH